MLLVGGGGGEGVGAAMGRPAVDVVGVVIDGADSAVPVVDDGARFVAPPFLVVVIIGPNDFSFRRGLGLTLFEGAGAGG